MNQHRYLDMLVTLRCCSQKAPPPNNWLLHHDNVPAHDAPFDSKQKIPRLDLQHYFILCNILLSDISKNENWIKTTRIAWYSRACGQNTEQHFLMFRTFKSMWIKYWKALEKTNSSNVLNRLWRRQSLSTCKYENRLHTLIKINVAKN